MIPEKLSTRSGDHDGLARAIFLGTQYFRPPNPRPEDFDRDLKLMRESGVRVAKTWVYWSKVNPRPGSWDFALYDRFFDAAERQGMQVLIQIMADSAPHWLAAQRPEWLYVDSSGKPVPLRPTQWIQIGGWPGFCTHHSEARVAIAEFIRLTAERYRNRAGLHSYDVWNECSLPSCRCPATQASFRSYLRKKYGDIDGLNAAYGGSTYTEFSEVIIPADTPTPPTDPPFVVQFDWFDFHCDVKSERMRWLVETLAGSDATHPLVSHHAGGGVVWDTDLWDLAAPLDKWGVSIYSGDYHLPEYGIFLPPQEARLTPDTLRLIALQFNMTRDSAAGKSWWLAEHTAGSFFTGYGYGRRPPRESTLKTLLAFSFGAEASLYWQWRPEIFGQEAPHFGITGLNGEPTAQLDAVRDIGRMLEEHQGIFSEMTWSRPAVGMLWDPTAAWFAHWTTNKTGLRHFAGWYGALIDSGYDVEILNARRVVAEGLPPAIKLLIAPVQSFDRPGLAPRLAEWVKNGGVLVGGPLFQLFGLDHLANSAFPTAPLSEVFGARHDALEYPNPPRVGDIAGELLLETYVLQGAQAWGHWQGKPAMTCNACGAGHAILIGSFLGAAYPQHNRQQVLELTQRIARLAGVEPQIAASGECLARVARSGKSMVAFVFNLADEATQCDVTIPNAGSRARDLLSGQQYLRSTAGLFHVALEPKASSILLI